MIYVIGSGPAGVACASALVERGLEVSMLDAGVDLEQARRVAVERLGELDPSGWSGDTVDQIRSGSATTLGGVPLKRAYGSDYPYRDVDVHIPWRTVGVATRPTLALGGFSSVWGAAVLPYRQNDIADWPITTEELAPHYRKIFEWMDLSAVDDDLASILPLYSESHDPLEPSSQARALMDDIRRSHAQLSGAGFRAGYARLAVRSKASGSRFGCVYCGLCLHGCPYGLIYNAATTVKRLQELGRFRYVGGVVVSGIEETSQGVRIQATTLGDGKSCKFQGDRVYVAAGVVSTTRLLLQSMQAHDRPVTLHDSQYFLLPWLRRLPEADPSEEPLHTLSQVFLELDDPEISSRSIHLQVYTYNDLYRRTLTGKLGLLSGVAGPLIRRLVPRMLLIQGYLHSDDSRTASATLRRTGSAGPATLMLEARKNPRTRRAFGKIVRKLLRHRRQFRALPVPLGVAPPGRGFHSGGTFPMRESPGEFECDILGRPTGFRRVHIVDASVFPSIPATTITLSVMANAHRIGSAHDQT